MTIMRLTNSASNICGERPLGWIRMRCNTMAEDGKETWSKL